ncbi:MAG: hypothetical protein E6575_19000, partial [Bradyrhizobium sp.]|nr:hypothetical protein [Bradyrhizobium sp.]
PPLVTRQHDILRWMLARLRFDLDARLSAGFCEVKLEAKIADISAANVDCPLLELSAIAQIRANRLRTD